MNPIIINSQNALEDLESVITASDSIAWDTEFLRRDTYYAKLALLQLAIGSEIYIIDATLVDIKTIWDAIAASKAVKIIHSGRQDLEIMYHLFGTLPNNIFDTQIAARFCSFRADSSYLELCKIICEVDDLDKNLQSSNWLKRPLTPRMIDYAGMDVKYLFQIYSALQHIIKEQNLEESFNEKTYELLTNPDLYNKIVENAWRKIKYYKSNEKFLARLKIICAFREHAAQTFDIPRRYFLTDDQVISICNNLILNETMLLKIGELSSYMKQDKYKNKLLELCNILAKREIG